MTVGFVWEERELMLMDKLLKNEGKRTLTGHQPRNASSSEAATDFEQKSPKIVVLLPNSAFELENDGRV